MILSQIHNFVSSASSSSLRSSLCAPLNAALETSRQQLEKTINFQLIVDTCTMAGWLAGCLADESWRMVNCRPPNLSAVVVGIAQT